MNFYPETDIEAQAAKRVCSRCAVRKLCLETAMRNRERFGVWGGLTEQERTRLRRAPLRAA